MLKGRCKKFLNTFNTPITKFCRNVDISTAAYYKWQNGSLELSEPTQHRLDNYISQYGF